MDSILDIRIRKALNLSEGVTTRVRLTYSKPENRTTFNVVSAKTTEEMKCRITTWLDDHIHADNLACRLGAEEIDMDTRPRARYG